MVAESMFNVKISADDPDALPFFSLARSGRRFVYLCRVYNNAIGADVYFLSERRDGTVLSRSYATGRLTFADQTSDQQIVESLSHLDESSPDFNDALIAAVHAQIPTRETLLEAFRNTTVRVDLERNASPDVLDHLVELAMQVKHDENDRVLSSTAERILASDGTQMIDCKTWYHTSNAGQLLKAFKKEFNML